MIEGLYKIKKLEFKEKGDSIYRMLAVVPELNTIRMALKYIDFELSDEDRNEFYIYAVNNIYNKHFPYPYDEYRPPKYFKILLKEIKPICLLPKKDNIL